MAASKSFIDLKDAVYIFVRKYRNASILVAVLGFLLGITIAAVLATKSDTILTVAAPEPATPATTLRWVDNTSSSVQAVDSKQPTALEPSTTSEPVAATSAEVGTTASTSLTTVEGPAIANNTVDGFSPVNGKQVVWGDNFDTFDASKWSVENSTYGDGNNEMQCYVPRNTQVANGHLILTAKKESVTCPGNRTRKVSSGMVRGKNVQFEPGQGIEFRVKLTPSDEANQGGLWPALWSSSWGGGGWPKGGELDYLEVMTAKGFDNPVFSMHFAGKNGQHDLINKHQRLSEPFSAKWRTVRFDYGKGGKLRWYLDGELVHSVDSAPTLQGYPEPFNKTVTDLKINLAIGGRPGPLDDRALGSDGATFAVDYVKIFPL